MLVRARGHREVQDRANSEDDHAGNDSANHGFPFCLWERRQPHPSITARARTRVFSRNRYGGNLAIPLKDLVPSLRTAALTDRRGD